MQLPSKSPTKRARGRSAAFVTKAGTLRSGLVPGLFRPAGRKTWMGEWTEDGKQCRRSMGTADEAEAAAILVRLRSKALEAKAAAKSEGSAVKRGLAGAPAPKALMTEAEAFIAAKRKLEGKRGGFTKASGENMHYALKKFCFFVEHEGEPSPEQPRGKRQTRDRAKPSEVTKPPLGRAARTSDITDFSLESFYYWILETEGLPESTAETYVTRVRTFGLDHGLKLDRPAIARGSTRRDVIFTVAQVQALLENIDAHQKDPERAWALRFIIFCGCMCGMRRGEIAMCRPSWFNLPDGAPGTLRIPREIDYGRRVWRTKAKKDRTVEMAGQFREFLAVTRERWKDRSYMLSPESQGQRYRYDFRVPLYKYFESQGYRTSLSKEPKDPTANVPIYNIHAMRHTYVTALARDGVNASQLSTAAGMTQRTAERYSHAGVDADTVTRIFEGKTAGQARHEELMERLTGVDEKQDSITQTMIRLESIVQNYRNFAAMGGRHISFAQALREIANPLVWAQFAAEPPRGSGDAASASERD